MEIIFRRSSNTIHQMDFGNASCLISGVLDHSSNNTVFCLRCFDRVSKNHVSRGLPVPICNFIMFLAQLWGSCSTIVKTTRTTTSDMAMLCVLEWEQITGLKIIVCCRQSHLGTTFKEYSVNSKTLEMIKN